MPLGVIGIIYESRPNVTADAGALCLKSGNAVILRGGSESAAFQRAPFMRAWWRGLKAAGLPSGCIQLVPTTDRAAVGYMLADMADGIDVIVPRGGKSLIARVQAGGARPGDRASRGRLPRLRRPRRRSEMARDIVLNAKMRRTGVCGAAETLLVDRGCAATHLAPLIEDPARGRLRSARR